MGILQQLQGNKLEVFYVRPDTELLTGVPKLLENMMFGVLQEYARSGLFDSLTILSNLEIENSIPVIYKKLLREAKSHYFFMCTLPQFFNTQSQKLVKWHAHQI